MSTQESSNIQSLGNEIYFNKTRFQILSLALCLVYFPFGYACIYFFSAQEDMLLRGLIAILGLFYFIRVTFFKNIDYQFLENTIACILPPLYISMVYIGSMNNYHFIYITGCYTVPAVGVLFISRTWHFVLAASIMLISIPYFAYIYQVPKDIYISMILQLSAFLSLMTLMIAQRINSQKKLVLTLEQLNSSERNRLEASKMATLGEMAGGVAHEINNPVSIILGHAGIIKRHIQQENTNPQKIL